MNQFSNTSSQNTRIFTIPNIITCIGALVAIGAGYCVFTKQYTFGFILFIIGVISDFFDGYATRYIEKRKPGYGTSRIGEILDPIRDKLLILVVVFINIKFGLLIAIAELVSILALCFAQEAAGHHVITKTSKVITTIQFVLAPFFFLSQNDDLFFLFLVLSCIRGLSYLIEFEKYKKKSP